MSTKQQSASRIIPQSVGVLTAYYVELRLIHRSAGRRKCANIVNQDEVLTDMYKYVYIMHVHIHSASQSR